MPKTNQETRQADPTVARDEGYNDASIAEQGAAIHTAPAEATEAAFENRVAERLAEQAKAEELAAQRALEKAHLDAQDPIVYAYNNNAQAGESLIGVPLADLRQSTWNQLEPWMQASVAASKLYTKAEVI